MPVRTSKKTEPNAEPQPAPEAKAPAKRAQPKASRAPKAPAKDSSNDVEATAATRTTGQGRSRAAAKPEAAQKPGANAKSGRAVAKPVAVQKSGAAAKRVGAAANTAAAKTAVTKPEATAKSGRAAMGANGRSKAPATTASATAKTRRTATTAKSRSKARATTASATAKARRPATTVKSRSRANPKRPTSPAPKPPRKTPEEIAADWAARLDSDRPGLVAWVLDRLSEYYGRPIWHQSHDPTSQLVLTMLSANSADTNAEAAFEALRDAYEIEPLPDGADRTPRPRDGWGGKGIADLPPPDWHRVETAPLDELIDVIRPGGLGPQKAPRIQAALSALHDQAGGHSLEFLGRMEALEARQWMTQIPGIGPKTASVVLLFAFGLPLMPVDRHVERVGLRVGMLPPKVTADQAHEDFLALVPGDRMYECHVDLIRHGRSICHAQRPECGRCPIAERCRYVNPDAP